MPTPLSTLRKTYGNGTRHECINRAIRAELPDGNRCLDALAAVAARINNLRVAGSPVPEELADRLAVLIQERDGMARTIEEKHAVGQNTNRRRVTA